MMALGSLSLADTTSNATSVATRLLSRGRSPLWAAMLGTLALAGCQTASNTHDFDNVDRAMGSEANISSLSSVVNQNPSDASGYNVRGTALGRAGRYDQALADFNRAIEINPGFYQAYSNRALVQRKLNQNGQALADYNRSIELNPSYNEAYVGRGNLYRSQGQIDLALADFSRGIELEPTDPKAYNNRALIYQGQGRHDDAIADFTASMTYAPNAPAPHLGRGLSYLATADYKAALDDFNIVVRRDKDNYQGWTNQGLALEKLGERDAAHNAFARAQTLNPSYAPARDGMRRTAKAAA
ncbi:tetratricopeptide repeat protein [Kaistia terrae]|jgi:tetratricopeptide (TPR) repeat protein|uniref:Tetratricopeptide repeat protein n=1 Tax=Kaistia terrae TaxID=537017 RepID=A0ABW0PS02_9HYPH|nr:tetratricopeptide repeat protein [Kaistia terrae]MCX5580135.1 tetratricopeptide repeat protein [Kaistia terrae]